MICGAKTGAMVEKLPTEINPRDGLAHIVRLPLQVARMGEQVARLRQELQALRRGAYPLRHGAG